MASEAKGRGFDPRQPHQNLTSQRFKNTFLISCLLLHRLATKGACYLESSGSSAPTEIFILVDGREAAIGQALQRFRRPLNLIYIHRQMLHLRVAALVIPAILSLSGCTALHVARAWAQSKSEFHQCTSDSRIFCEPGSEELAKSIVSLMPGAVASIESAQFGQFAEPILIYTYSTRERFSIHSGADSRAAGSVSLGRLNLSPKLLETPERTQGILNHELSHLQLQLHMGTMAWARVPSWFHEGLATYVSGGGGAETVTPQEALDSMAKGTRFVPEESQWALFPKSAFSYGLLPHMYYRQAALFVGYLRESDGAAFEKMLKAVQAKAPFGDAVRSAYGKPLKSLWETFLEKSGIPARP